MSDIHYIEFATIDPDALLPVLNQGRVREHLVSHPEFDAGSVREWVDEKMEIDSLPGCRVRAIAIQDTLIGWCGIQPDNDDYEIAIVIAESSWGIGPQVFSDLLMWADEMGHREIVIHLLESRPAYKFLKRAATRVSRTRLMGRDFTTYHISVDSDPRHP